MAGEKFSGLTASLRAAKDGAIKRLTGAQSKKAAQTRKPAPPEIFDPTVGRFGSSEDGEEARENLPLGAQLEQSARAMSRRAQALKDGADALAARIRQSAEAEVSLAAQAIRVIIGVAWLGIAFWVFSGRAGASPGDAQILTRAFFIVATLALGVAFGIGALISATGKPSAALVRREGDALGRAMAKTAREFDEALQGFREAMERRGAASEAVVDLSRAHMTALEASAYYRDIAFAADADEANANWLFGQFLEQPRQRAAALPVFVSGLLLGGFAAAAGVYLEFGPQAGARLPASPLAVAAYPLALYALLLGGVLYAGAGFVAALFAGAIMPRAAAKARRQALSALRAAFAEQEAPRPEDIATRIEDALALYRSRLGGRGGGANQRAHRESEENAGDDENTAPWRRRDSTVKFVETGFSAAPARWRTDAYEKNFSPRPDAKRRPRDGKNRSGE